jgi:quercetin dioxygenase-like cupin family protein
MSVFHLRDFEDVSNRPGRRSRDLAGTVHGFDSVFVTEHEMDHGNSIPLHTHTVEEGWIVLEGELRVRIGSEWVTVPAGSVARIPPNTPHAVKNDADTTARVITCAPWSRDNFYAEATTYLDEA